MALKPLNSVGGFSVGEIPDTIIQANGDVTAGNATLDGNLYISNANANWGVLTDNLYYSNGVPWDLQEAAGSNTQIQFNNNNDFGASANLTFDASTNLLTVVGNAQFNNANLGNLATANFVNVASNIIGGNLNVNNSFSGNTANFSGNVVVPNLSVNLEIAGNTANFSGNVVAPNLNVNNVITGNTANFSGNVIVPNLNVNTTLSGNVANFSGNVVVPNLTVNLELAGNTANFSGNIVALNANLGNLVQANYVNVAQQVNGNVANFSGNLTAANANLGNLVTANYVNAAVDVNATGNISANNANIGSGNIDLYSNGEIAASTANFSGNVYAAYFVGNVQANITITAPNTTVLYSANGLVQGSNNFTFDYATNELYVNGNANVTGNIDVGGILTDNYYYANGAPVDFQQAAGSNTEIQFNNNNDFGASANFTWNSATNTLSVLGNANITTVNTSNVVGGGTDVTINANGYVSTFYGANGLVSLPAALTANGNLQVNNANLGNLAIANYVNVSQQINGNIANFSGNITAANAALGNLVTANYVNVANDLNVVGNVNAGNLVGTFANGNSNVKIYSNANIEFSSAGNANVVTITGTGLLVAGNIQSTTGNVLANGNVTANGHLVGANAVVTGEANVGSLVTSNITATTNNINIYAAGVDGSINFLPTGNGTIDASGFRITQVGGPTQPLDAATKEYVDSTSQGLTIHTAVRVTSATNLNATYANGGSVLTTIAISGGKTIQFGAAHGLSVGDELAWDNSFNGIIGDDPYFVYSTPAADTITVKAGYFGAEVTTLTNGTGLSQTARANTGVGATLTNAGANAAISIDGVALASTNRVLVQGQTNQFENGIYTVTTVGNGSTAWVLTRATDADTYSPTETTALGYGDYFFVQQGSSYAGSSYVLTTPVGEILFGLTNIQFSQFSAAGSYSAGNGISITGTVISANVDNDTTAIVSGNIVVKASANLTTPNIGDATFSSLSWNTLSNGNVSANNLSISNIANITANLTVGGFIQANGTISSNSNVSGLNITTSGNVEASGNVLANNVNANTLLTVPTANVSNIVNAGNVNITNALTGNTANFSSNVIVNNLTVNLELAGNTANFSGNAVFNGANVTVGNALFGNTANFSGNVILPNLTVNLELAGNTANFSGNIVAANLVTSGTANVANLNVTANVTSALLPNANVTHDLGSSSQRWGNIYGANLDVSGNINSTGNLSANNFSANVFIANTAIEIGPTIIYAGNITTSSITANQTISQVPVVGVTGVEWLVKGYDSSGAKYSMAMITAVTDGATAEYSTFGSVTLGSTTGTLAVNVVGANIALQVTPSSSNSTVWVTQYRTL
jgi:hypothetical protein